MFCDIKYTVYGRLLQANVGECRNGDDDPQRISCAVIITISQVFPLPYPLADYDVSKLCQKTLWGSILKGNIDWSILQHIRVRVVSGPKFAAIIISH